MNEYEINENKNQADLKTLNHHTSELQHMLIHVQENKLNRPASFAMSG